MVAAAPAARADRDRGRGKGEVRAQPPGPGARRGQEKFGPVFGFLRAESQHRLDAGGRGQDTGDAQQGSGEHIDDLRPAARDEPEDQFPEGVIAANHLRDHGPEPPGDPSEQGREKAPADEGGSLLAPGQAQEGATAGAGTLPAGTFRQQGWAPRPLRALSITTATARAGAPSGPAAAPDRRPRRAGNVAPPDG